MMIWSGSGSGVDLHRRSGGEECRGEEVKRRLICIKQYIIVYYKLAFDKGGVIEYSCYV